ncbi:hypothetical protein C8J57DRAFT_1280074 [Mycena rebaudengoi]|nr:hypothetical protein C8J57DRAFT_1280074 [Mycena rebaudengoi]
MLAILSAISAVFLLSVNVATAQDGGLSDQQQCLLNCSTGAPVAASGCDVQDTPCLCASTVYANAVFECAEKPCGIPLDTLQGFLADGCKDVPSGGSKTASGGPSTTSSDGASKTSLGGASKTSSDGTSKTGSTQGGSSTSSGPQSDTSAPPKESDKPGSAELNAPRTGVAAAVALGLGICALLM